MYANVKTWNVLDTKYTFYNKRQCKPVGINNKDEEIRIDHILHIIEDNIASNLDILFLQEVPDKLFSKLSEIYDYHQNKVIITSGELVILIRNINKDNISIANILLEGEDEEDKILTRCQCVKFQNEYSSFLLINVHIPFTENSMIKRSDVIARINNLIEQYKDDNNYIIIAGDTNSDGNPPEFSELTVAKTQLDKPTSYKHGVCKEDNGKIIYAPNALEKRSTYEDYIYLSKNLKPLSLFKYNNYKKLENNFLVKNNISTLNDINPPYSKCNDEECEDLTYESNPLWPSDHAFLDLRIALLQQQPQAQPINKLSKYAPSFVPPQIESKVSNAFVQPSNLQQIKLNLSKNAPSFVPPQPQPQPQIKGGFDKYEKLYKKYKYKYLYLKNNK